MKRGRILRIARAAGLVVALVFLAFAVRSAWIELASGSPVRPDPAILTGALALLVATYLGMVALWRMLLTDIGARLGYRQAVQLWSFSNLGRYIPGKIWQMLGLVAFAKEVGVAPGLAVAAAVLALWLMVGTGAVVGVALLPGSVPRDPLVLAAIGLAGASLIAPLLRPDWIHRSLRRLPPSLGCGEIADIGRGVVARWIVLFAAAWAVHGAVFSVFAFAFGGVDPAQTGALTGAWSLAYVIGLAAVVVPGGIGVREGMLAWLLGPALGDGAPVHVIAVASRLWAIAAELAVFGLAAALRLRNGKDPR